MSQVITTTVSNDSLTSAMNTDTLNDSYNTIVKQINNGYKFVYGNTVLSAVLGMILILYSAKAAPELPRALNRLFEIPLFKIVFMFLLAYITSKDPSVALITAIILYLSIQALSYYESSMKLKCKKNRLSPSDKYLPKNIKLNKNQAKLLNLFLKHSEKLNKNMKVENFANTDLLDECRREAFTVDAIVDKSLTTIQNNIAVSKALNNGDSVSAQKHMEEINKTNTELSLLLQSQLSSSPAPERLVKDILTTINTSPSSVESALSMTTTPSQLREIASNNIGQLPALLSPSSNLNSPSAMTSILNSIVSLVSPAEQSTPLVGTNSLVGTSPLVGVSPSAQVVSLLPPATNALNNTTTALNNTSTALNNTNTALNNTSTNTLNNTNTAPSAMPTVFVSPSSLVEPVKVDIPNMLSEIKNILSTSPFVSKALGSQPEPLPNLQATPASVNYLLAPAVNKQVSPVVTLPTLPTATGLLPTQQALVNVSPVITLPNTSQSQLNPIVNFPSLPPVASLPEPVVNVQVPVAPLVTKPSYEQTKPSLQTVTTLSQMIYQSEPNPMDNELYATYESKEDNTLLGNCMPAYSNNNNTCSLNNSSINAYDSNDLALY